MGGFSTFFSLADASGFARRAGSERPNPSFVLGWSMAGAESILSGGSARSGGRISDKANINLRKTLPLASRRWTSFSRQRRALDRAGPCAQRAADPATRALPPGPDRGGVPACGHGRDGGSLPPCHASLSELMRRLVLTARTRLFFRLPAHPAGALSRLSGRVRALYSPAANAHSALDNADPTRNKLTTVLALV
jgi:hypothetical protein